MSVKSVAAHQSKDPSALTPAEQKIHDLRTQGLTWDAIANQIGKGSGKTLARRYAEIKHKLASAGKGV